MPGIKKAVHRRIKKKEAVKRNELLAERKEARDAEQTAKQFIDMGHPDIALRHTRRIVVSEAKAKELEHKMTAASKPLKYLTASRQAKKRLKRMRAFKKKKANG